MMSFTKMISFAIALAIPSGACVAADAGLSCPGTGNSVKSVNAKTAYSDYKNVRYYYCCPSCKPDFDANPEKSIKAYPNKTLGVGLYDPVSKKKIAPNPSAKFKYDSKGVRYVFSSQRNLTAFKKDPAGFLKGYDRLRS